MILCYLIWKMAQPKRISFLADNNDNSNVTCPSSSLQMAKRTYKFPYLEKAMDGDTTGDDNETEDELPSPKKHKLEDDNEEEEEEEESDDDVMAMIACDVVHEMKKKILKYKDDEYTDNNSDSDEDDNMVNDIFEKFKSKLKQAFFDKYYHYITLYEKWLEDDITKSISKQFLKNINKKSFTSKEALADALSKHKQVIYSRFKNCLEDLIDDEDEAETTD